MRMKVGFGPDARKSFSDLLHGALALDRSAFSASLALRFNA